MVKFSSPAAARLFLANSPAAGRDRRSIAEHGFSLRYTDPAAMLAWCEAAAFNIPAATPAPEAAMLLAHLGNAHRVSCNFRQARTYLRQALAKTPADPLILEFYASLMKDMRQFRRASAFLGRAAKLRRCTGDSPNLATTLLQSALVLDEAGLSAQAADSVLGALDTIGLLPESEERERLARAGIQNLASYLVNAGKAQEALWIVKLCKERLMLGGEVYCLRVEWLMADIAGALGEIDNAVAAYQEIRRRFAALGHSQEVAIVTLDLARLLLAPRPLQAREEALAVSPILDQLGIPANARERTLLAKVVETGSEAALVELAAVLRANALARRARTFPNLPGTL